MFKYKFQDLSYDLYINQQYKMEFYIGNYPVHDSESFKVQAIDFYALVREELSNLESMCSCEEDKKLNWHFANQQVKKKFKELFEKYLLNTNMMLNPKKIDITECLFKNYKEHLQYIKSRYENNPQIILDWLTELPDTLDNLFEELYLYKKEKGNKPTFNNQHLYKEIKVDAPNIHWVDPAV